MGTATTPKGKGRGRRSESVASATSPSPPPPRRPPVKKRAASSSKSRKASLSRSPAKKAGTEGAAATRRRTKTAAPSASPSPRRKSTRATPAKTPRRRASRSTSVVRRSSAKKSDVGAGGGAGGENGVNQGSVMQRVFLVLAIFVVLGCIWLVQAKGNGAKEQVNAVIAWIKSLSGPATVFAFIAIHSLAVTVCFPATVAFEFAAGGMFGLVGGVAVVSTSKAIGAAVAMLLGRTVAREFVEQRLASRPRIRKTLKAVEKDQLRVAFLLRLSPMPSWVNNYGLALTPISFPVFMAATVIGGLMFNVNNVLMGLGLFESIGTVAEGASAGPGSYIKLIGIGASLATCAVFARIITNATKDLDPEDL